MQSDDEIGDDDDENALDDGSGEEDDGRHVRMLQGITGMPTETFEGKKFNVRFWHINSFHSESYRSILLSEL